MHIFKECSIARDFWEEISHWWSLSNLQKRIMLSEHWSTRKIFTGAKLSQIWNQVMTAALWTLCLARNELIFEKKKNSPQTMIHLLKFRSFKWLQASGKMIKELQNLWFVNPMGAFLVLSKKIGDKGPVWWNVEYIGFTDGAWERLESGLVKSGI